MLNGAIIDAALGDVDVTTSGDALVTGITSGSSDSAAVSIVAGGHVLAGTNPVRVDITAMTPGAGVSITAALGIGNETEADSEANDQLSEAPGTANLITPTPNPLIIRTGVLALESAGGDIDVTTIADVNSGTIAAATGSINLTAQQDFAVTDISAPLGAVSVQSSGAVDINQISAGTGAGATHAQITVSAATSLTIGAATSGGTQTLTSQGALTFTQLTTTGVPGDPGRGRPYILCRRGDGRRHRGQRRRRHSRAERRARRCVGGGRPGGHRVGDDIDWRSAVDRRLGVAVGGRGPEVVHLDGGDDALGGFDGRLADDWRSDERRQADADVVRRVDVHPADPRPASPVIRAPVDLTSYAGAVTGGDIDANGGVDIHGQSVALDDVSAAEGPVVIVSATTLTGEALSTGGSASLSAGGDLRWSTFTVGTTLSAASTGGSLTIGAATSGGHADADVVRRVDVHPADHDRRPRRSRGGRPHLLRRRGDGRRHRRQRRRRHSRAERGAR